MLIIHCFLKNSQIVSNITRILFPVTINAILRLLIWWRKISISINPDKWNRSIFCINRNDVKRYKMTWIVPNRVHHLNCVGVAKEVFPESWVLSKAYWRLIVPIVPNNKLKSLSENSQLILGPDHIIFLQASESWGARKHMFCQFSDSPITGIG